MTRRFFGLDSEDGEKGSGTSFDRPRAVTTSALWGGSLFGGGDFIDPGSFLSFGFCDPSVCEGENARGHYRKREGQSGGVVGAGDPVFTIAG